MEKQKNIYWANFPLMLAIVVGIFPAIVLYLAITTQTAESIKMFFYSLIGSAVIILNFWMARFTRDNFVFGSLPPYVIYVAIKRFKELKYLTIPYLVSWVVILILVIFFVPIK